MISHVIILRRKYSSIVQYNGRLAEVIVGRSCPHIWRWQERVVKDQISPVPPPPPPFKKQQATYEQITLQGVPREKKKENNNTGLVDLCCLCA